MSEVYTRKNTQQRTIRHQSRKRRGPSQRNRVSTHRRRLNECVECSGALVTGTEGEITCQQCEIIIAMGSHHQDGMDWNTNTPASRLGTGPVYVDRITGDIRNSRFRERKDWASKCISNAKQLGFSPRLIGEMKAHQKGINELGDCRQDTKCSEEARVSACVAAVCQVFRDLGISTPLVVLPSDCTPKMVQRRASKFRTRIRQDPVRSSLSIVDFSDRFRSAVENQIMQACVDASPTFGEGVALEILNRSQDLISFSIKKEPNLSPVQLADVIIRLLSTDSPEIHNLLPSMKERRGSMAAQKRLLGAMMERNGGEGE